MHMAVQMPAALFRVARHDVGSRSASDMCLLTGSTSSAWPWTWTNLTGTAQHSQIASAPWLASGRLFGCHLGNRCQASARQQRHQVPTYLGCQNCKPDKASLDPGSTLEIDVQTRPDTPRLSSSPAQRHSTELLFFFGNTILADTLISIRSLCFTPFPPGSLWALWTSG